MDDDGEGTSRESSTMAQCSTSRASPSASTSAGAGAKRGGGAGRRKSGSSKTMANDASTSTPASFAAILASQQQHWHGCENGDDRGDDDGGESAAQQLEHLSQARGRGLDEIDSEAAAHSPPPATSATRLSTRGRRKDMSLPPSRARENSRAHRERRAAYVRALETRVHALSVYSRALEHLALHPHVSFDGNDGVASGASAARAQDEREHCSACGSPLLKSNSAFVATAEQKTQIKLAHERYLSAVKGLPEPATSGLPPALTAHMGAPSLASALSPLSEEQQQQPPPNVLSSSSSSSPPESSVAPQSAIIKAAMAPPSEEHKPSTGALHSALAAPSPSFAHMQQRALYQTPQQSGALALPPLQPWQNPNHPALPPMALQPHYNGAPPIIASPPSQSPRQQYFPASADQRSPFQLSPAMPFHPPPPPAARPQLHPSSSCGTTTCSPASTGAHNEGASAYNRETTPGENGCGPRKRRRSSLAPPPHSLPSGASTPASIPAVSRSSSLSIDTSFNALHVQPHASMPLDARGAPLSSSGVVASEVGSNGPRSASTERRPSASAPQYYATRLPTSSERCCPDPSVPSCVTSDVRSTSAPQPPPPAPPHAHPPMMLPRLKAPPGSRCGPDGPYPLCCDEWYEEAVATGMLPPPDPASGVVLPGPAPAPAPQP